MLNENFCPEVWLPQAAFRATVALRRRNPGASFISVRPLLSLSGMMLQGTLGKMHSSLSKQNKRKKKQRKFNLVQL